MKWRFHSYNNISFHGAFENVLLEVHGFMGSCDKIDGNTTKLAYNLAS
jgi:hypothetical protein